MRWYYNRKDDVDAQDLEHRAAMHKLDLKEHRRSSLRRVDSDMRGTSSYTGSVHTVNPSAHPSALPFLLCMLQSKCAPGCLSTVLFLLLWLSGCVSRGQQSGACHAFECVFLLLLRATVEARCMNNSCCQVPLQVRANTWEPTARCLQSACAALGRSAGACNPTTQTSA